MDPTANLATQRALASVIVTTAERRTSPRGVEFEQQCIELAEHVEALDDWISKGGFIPDQWREVPHG